MGWLVGLVLLHWLLSGDTSLGLPVVIHFPGCTPEDGDVQHSPVKTTHHHNALCLCCHLAVLLPGFCALQQRSPSWEVGCAQKQSPVDGAKVTKQETYLLYITWMWIEVRFTFVFAVADYGRRMWEEDISHPICSRSTELSTFLSWIKFVFLLLLKHCPKQQWALVKYQIMPQFQVQSDLSLSYSVMPLFYFIFLPLWLSIC